MGGYLARRGRWPYGKKMLFPGFDLTELALPRGPIRLRQGGDGPALLLLHGTPQTHLMWHAIAPHLATTMRVICPDLRGHGGSFRPDPEAATATAEYTAAAMADDLAALMDALGHSDFAVAGQGRGAQVALRLALDHPHRVHRLAALEWVPSLPREETKDMAGALATYPGFWFFEPRTLAEQIATLAPRAWFNTHETDQTEAASFFHPEALADYLAAAESPGGRAAIRQSLRAAGGIDRLAERIARAEGWRMAADVLVLWAAQGSIGGWYDPCAPWRDYTTGAVSGAAINAGPYLAEEAPDQLAGRLQAFFAG